MPSAIHEVFADKVSDEIKDQRRSIASRQGLSAEFAREIESWASSKLKFDDPDLGKHEPDAMFGHSEARYPGVVIEVSYSQKKKDLGRLADGYILGSVG